MVKSVEKFFGEKKDEIPFAQETIFEARFEQEKQIVSALHMVGAGFETRGGCSLMLTETVENGVDAIIKYHYLHKPVKSKINVHIDRKNKKILIIDSGTGFLEVKHVCEKPFDSLKETDNSQTGKFARGLQGFRAFCKKLTYITRRLPEDIPSDEKDVIKGNGTKDSQTVMIQFSDMSGKTKVKYMNNNVFNEYTKSQHGTVAIYEDWKPGQFEKLHITTLLKRLQHHFGELVRQGNIKILVSMYEGKIQDIGPAQEKYQEVQPRDYSDYTPINIKSIPYDKNGNKGEIKFNLYLCERGRTDRWNNPYLLYQGRPVGDGFISEIDEFIDYPIWKHKFITGYINCDFCEINELRQGLKINDERDFLFEQLLKTQKFLEKKVKEHSKGLYELKLQKQVNELVRDLQLFFKNKNIFNFKIAKSTGFLSKENNEIEIVELAKTSGDNTELEIKSKEGEDTEISGTDKFESTEVEKVENGEANTLNTEVGGKGGTHAETKVGSPGDDAIENLSNGEKGFKSSDTGYDKPAQEKALLTSGGEEKSKRKAKRHKPKGFGMVFQDDEFNEDMSWFDEVNSMIIINSQHPRYLARAEDENHMKSLMNFLAELYIWEITNLIHAKDEEVIKGKKFLGYKFEYFENVRDEAKAGNTQNA